MAIIREHVYGSIRVMNDALKNASKENEANQKSLLGTDSDDYFAGKMADCVLKAFTDFINGPETFALLSALEAMKDTPYAVLATSISVWLQVLQLSVQP